MKFWKKTDEVLWKIWWNFENSLMKFWKEIDEILARIRWNFENTLVKSWEKFWKKVNEVFWKTLWLLRRRKKKLLRGGPWKPHKLGLFSPLLTPLFHEHSHKVFGVLLYAISDSCDSSEENLGEILRKMWWNLEKNLGKLWEKFGEILEKNWSFSENLVKSGEQFCEKHWGKFGKILRTVL